MASTFFGLTIAYTGLQAAQTSINVTSHNLANINNQSYTKETASIKAGEALRSYAKYGTLGAGVIVDAINQTRDSYYDEKYRNNYTNYGQYNVKDTYMSQIQNYLNEFTLKGYSTEYENFFAALNQLDLTPADTSAKNQLINNAKSMTDYFNTLATNLRNVQIDANNEIKDTVNQINSLAQSISSLNKQINQIQANYGNANDLKDQRNALIDDLSKLVNISVSETDIGNNLTDLQITINGNSLVNGYNYHTLQTVSRDEPRNVSDAAGLYDIQWETGQPFNIYSTSLGGELKGLIDIRDGCNGEIEKYATTTDDDGNETYKTDAEGNILTDTVSKVDSNTNYKGVPYYQAQLNQFIQTFVSSINEILTKGVTSDGSASGIPLFVMSDGSKALTASSVTVNRNLIDNADLLGLCSVGTGQAVQKAQFICTEVNACEIWLLPGKSAAVDKFSIGIILGNLLGSIKQLCTMGEHNVVFGIGIPADGVFNICGCNRLGEIYGTAIFGCNSGSGVGSHLVPSAVVGTSGQD